MGEASASWLARYQMPRYRVPGKSADLYAGLNCNRGQKGPLRTAQVRRTAAGHLSKRGKRKGAHLVLKTVGDVRKYQAEQDRRGVYKKTGGLSPEKSIAGSPKKSVAGSPLKSAIATPLQTAMSEIDEEMNEIRVEVARKQGELSGIQRVKASVARALFGRGSE